MTYHQIYENKISHTNCNCCYINANDSFLQIKRILHRHRQDVAAELSEVVSDEAITGLTV